jgi:hypothetical protein
MGMTFSHSLAGFAGFAATFVTPWYSADPSLIPIAIVLLLGLILLCVIVAIFQRSTRKKEGQAPKQSQTTESQMFQTLEHAIDEGRASLDLDVAASPSTHQEIPSPLAELALQVDQSLPEPKTEHVPIPRMASNGTNSNGIAHPPPNPARVETAHVSLPRLSELRGMRFSQALRELDKAKRIAPANAGLNSLNRSHSDALAEKHYDMPIGELSDPIDDPINDPINETLLSAIAPFEAMFASAPPAKNRGRRREDSARSPLEPKAPGTETNGFVDQLHILPSRRGQYKKKG